MYDVILFKSIVCRVKISQRNLLVVEKIVLVNIEKSLIMHALQSSNLYEYIRVNLCKGNSHKTAPFLVADKHMHEFVWKWEQMFISTIRNW